jgi:hypothetical protein
VPSILMIKLVFQKNLTFISASLTYRVSPFKGVFYIDYLGWSVTSFTFWQQEVRL